MLKLSLADCRYENGDIYDTGICSW